MRRGSLANRFCDRYVGIPLLAITSLLNKRRSRPSQFTRIGLIASPTLGDTLINSAAVQDIRDHFPHARIIYFSSKTSAAAVKLLPSVDEIVNIDITRPLYTIRAMRQCKLDLMLDFTQWQRLTAFYTAASGAKYRVGFRSDNQHRHWHYDAVADHSSSVHELENFRALLRVLGLNPSAAPMLRLPEVLPPQFDHSHKWIVFHPWASGDRHLLREWSYENWVELAGRLNSPGILFVITGAPKEEPKSAELCTHLQAAGLRATTYVSPDGLESLSLLLKGSELVVSVNTGVMHLAAILGVPTIALNGPTSTRRWGPVGPLTHSVEPDGGGGGFLHFGFEYPGNTESCMGRIRVDDVVSAAQILMSVGQGLARKANA